MSTIDQAFIRAYQSEQAKSSPVRSDAPVGGPHVQFPAAGGAGAGARRPLSTFTAPPPVEGRFRPALEVDAVRWPDVVDILVQRHAARFDAARDVLHAAHQSGRTLIGVAGAASAIGCTTTTLCLARLLIDDGLSVALVDAHFVAAGLARTLGMAVDVGWEDVLAGRLPLAEAAVHSLGDRLALLPLVQGGVAAAEKLESIHASVTAGVLRYHYDLVLFDLGALADAAQRAIAGRVVQRCRLDGAALVVDAARARQASPARLTAAAPALAAICLGVVENAGAAA